MGTKPALDYYGCTGMSWEENCMGKPKYNNSLQQESHNMYICESSIGLDSAILTHAVKYLACKVVLLTGFLIPS